MTEDLCAPTIALGVAHGVLWTVVGIGYARDTLNRSQVILALLSAAIGLGTQV